jgi:aldehyde dehydrogenase (NAD+)
MTKNVDTINTVTRAFKAGTVWVNAYGVLTPLAPFGDYKSSGFGRENGAYAPTSEVGDYNPTYL